MPAPRVDMLLELKNFYATHTALLSGEWDEKIKEVQTMIDEAHQAWDKVASGQTLDDLKKSADEYAAKIHSEADEYLANIKAQGDDLVSKLEEHASNVVSHSVIVESFQKMKASFEHEVQDFHDMFARKNGELSAKESQLAEQASAQADQQAMLDSREADVNNKISTIQSLAK